jgi:NitT/TauT family transport system substrate-binding protein
MHIARWAGLASLALLTAVPAMAADMARFGTNWRAEAEHGGFYQAAADGTYAQYGLDVTIVPVGPQANDLSLLLADRLDFAMGLNLIQAFEWVHEDVPLVMVAAEFQKDPMAFLSHPGVGIDRWSELPGATAFVGEQALVSVNRWLHHAYGFSADNVKPYTFNMAPFIVDEHSILPGYVTSEPYEIERAGGFAPNVFLLADHGYSTYSTTIVARHETIERNPDLVRRFVDASAIGWKHYLAGDNAKANAAIKAANPDITDGEIAYAIARIKEYGIVDSGDALTMGIVAMTDARVQDFSRRRRTPSSLASRRLHPQMPPKHVRVRLDLFGRPLVHDMTVVDDVGAGRERERRSEVLFDEDDRLPLGREVAADFHKVTHDDRGEAFEGLVQQQNFRIAHQGAGDRQHLLLAA